MSVRVHPQTSPFSFVNSGWGSPYQVQTACDSYSKREYDKGRSLFQALFAQNSGIREAIDTAVRLVNEPCLFLDIRRSYREAGCGLLIDLVEAGHALEEIKSICSRFEPECSIPIYIALVKRGHALEEAQQALTSSWETRLNLKLYAALVEKGLLLEKAVEVADLSLWPDEYFNIPHLSEVFDLLCALVKKGLALKNAESALDLSWRIHGVQEETYQRLSAALLKAREHQI